MVLVGCPALSQHWRGLDPRAQPGSGLEAAGMSF